jgi:hypothetical protein
MPNWLTCRLTGRHDYTVKCENGAMFLRCANCGRRSQGWQVASKAPARDLAVPPRPRTTPQVSRLSTVRSD